METGYEWLQRITKERMANLTIPKEATQNILILKSAGSKLLEEKDPKQYFTFRHGDKFGFSELQVNMLMQMAYEEGRKDIDPRSFDIGFNKAQSELTKKILEALDVQECSGCNNF